MAEPSASRARGLGDDRRHSGHKRERSRTRGEDQDDARRVRRRYDGDRRRYSRGESQEPSTSETRHHHNHRHHPSHRDDDRRDRRPRRSSIPSSHTPNELPFGARPLTRSDLDAFRPLLARYLDVQKRRDIAMMDEREIRGRWKSFVGKWNRGDLAEGWYDPAMLAEAKNTGAGAHARDNREERTESPPPHSRRGDRDSAPSEEEEEGEEEDDEYGPTLPPGSTRTSGKHGPGIPTLQDLSAQREDAVEARIQDIEDLRFARKADRAEQRARLDELVPKADAGTRERRLEKRREVNEKMRGFRERSPGAAEIGEAELMGGGGDGVAEYKRAKAAAERRRTEREVRREEEARAKAAEREERVREYRRKEEGTMEVLRRIARERFG
ncbi:hypothetical protein F5Y04DRAFT_289972 [Hypomontagnella monticulosa]|nr:hypothetical protein F5Y04DRAFT_289972 [Hypomontagnella monticulosa]